MKQSKMKAMRCGLGITDNARKGITKVAKDEHAFFSMQEAFDVHIEKRSNNRQGNMSFSLYFDNGTNEILAKCLNNRVAVMECVYQNDGFLATGFQLRGRKEPIQTNRRLPARLKFLVGRSTGIAMPIELYTSIRELPIAEERSAYVKKRIASWEGYLRVEERNADVADVTASFSQASLNEDFSKLSIVCTDLKGKDWNTIKGFSAKMIGLQSDIGNVVNTDRSKRIVEIELSRKYKEMARRNEWKPKAYKEITFSNFAALSQVKRLRKGFKNLQDGLAANANLEKVLFEERPVVRISKNQQELVFHNELNKFQKEAVTGAMTANDLYVIQGPPGTGKTTVISEICQQNVKAGLRTLVASQANLAVDNALGRLLTHQDIRILRYGRTESIEEEGKKFIEENVALNWRNITLESVNSQLQSNSTREAELQAEWLSCEEQIQTLQDELVLVDEQIRLKEAAQAEHFTRSEELKKLYIKMKNIDSQQRELLAKQVAVQKSADDLAVEMKRIEHLLQLETSNPEIDRQMESIEEQVKQLRHYISYRQTVQRIGATGNTIATILKEIEVKNNEISTFHLFVKDIQSLTKLETVKNHMASFGVTVPFATNWKMTELNQLIDTIKSDTSGDDYSEWQELNSRLLTAIDMIERLLKDNGVHMKPVKRNANQKFNSIKEIHELIDRVGRFLVQPSTKRSLETRNYSAERYDNLEKIADALEIVRERKNYATKQIANFEKQNQIKLDSKKMFAVIKTEIIEQVKLSIVDVEQEVGVLQRKVEDEQNVLENLKHQNAEIPQMPEAVDETAAVHLVEEELEKKVKVYADFKKKRATFEQYEHELASKKNDVQDIADQLEKASASLQALNQESSSVQKEISEQKEQLASLVELLDKNPEEMRKQTLTSIRVLSSKVEKLKVDKKRLPSIHELQKEWFSHLTEANEYDLDEIRKLYVKHANVIGTTCVASARRDFVEEYPTFDVVIIDEVSKATPPELLLPMLKGKKIILVGDHHQLPPLMGQATLEELLEESDSFEEKKELEKLLKESLFERLFRTLPKQNKTMLGIQYRMHESIMKTISPFYEEGDYSLQCGLTDSDSARDHLIDSRYVQRSDHLLWFDMPNEPKYFEEKVKGGTSRFNQAELDMTRKILMDLDEATEKAKVAGTMKQTDKKSVGVISFYGEQVKRIDRMIQQDLMPQQLNCRTGSVDKFQGMEMDVIIVSFVRNHQEKGGDIGFARDYRRLNVALSRARELLIIVGSSDMFTVRAKHPSTKEMYGRLLNTIKMKKGFRDTIGNVK
ncbi:AAA domain-containing protein [Filibacter tadaridae]|uniref:ATP-dependent RecD-like DNA helicase n=1 Tax=Filibacter tadaridae TaxID=2483811 RepID=A0A3P5WRC6_9BACL|nr:AAA domain-containing protein [Filibacter tadaridae]VDC25953.1 ATP-dependent RecD-like DNA helicase [Filibacter tadaridae]